jgi:hypothetical protein
VSERVRVRSSSFVGLLLLLSVFICCASPACRLVRAGVFCTVQRYDFTVCVLCRSLLVGLLVCFVLFCFCLVFFSPGLLQSVGVIFNQGYTWDGSVLASDIRVWTVGCVLRSCSGAIAELRAPSALTVLRVCYSRFRLTSESVFAAPRRIRFRKILVGSSSLAMSSFR